MGRTAIETAGVIAVRVWIDSDSEPRLRARITASKDLSGGEQTSTASAGIQEILAFVSDRLEAFAAA